MKPIKIDDKATNLNAIERELANINGAAHQHTYSVASQIAQIAEAAEEKLADLGIPAKYRTGAAFIKTSGDPVPKAYAKKSRSRIATRVTLERRATGWFLAACQRTDIHADGGGKGRLILTAAQAEIARNQFEKQFCVAIAA